MICSIWQAAMSGMGPFDQAYSVERLADRVGMAAGMLEGDPSLADPPKPPSRSTASEGAGVTVLGDGNVVTFSGRDSVVQHVQTGVGHAQLRQILDEVKAALAELAEDDEDVKDRHLAVDRLGEHLTKAEPEGRPINRTWERIVTFATVEGAIQGGERIGRALQALWPYVEPWVDGPPPMLPGVTT
jgi:hypothetical protein